MKPHVGLIGLIGLLIVVPATVAQELPKGHPPVIQQGHAGAASANLTKKGKVLSIINVSQYTYIEVMEGQKSYWLATTTIPVKKDDIIRFDDGVIMTNFRSNTLNRTFPAITFVASVVVADGK